MDFDRFDKRGYPVVSAEVGYGEWARRYEETVAVALDGSLLPMLKSVAWNHVGRAADLACGTGRTGAWLAERGVAAIDGVDITPRMLAVAEGRGIYRSLRHADAADTGLVGSTYDLCALVLADEHLAELAPVYREAARLLAPGGTFLVLGYHPFFLMNGVPTHYHREDGEAVAIRSYIHLFSEHHQAGTEAGLGLAEFRESVIDEAWLGTKPKWRKYLGWPASFAMVWRAG